MVCKDKQAAVHWKQYENLGKSLDLYQSLIFSGGNKSQVRNQGHRMIQKLAPGLREPAGRLPSALLFSLRLGAMKPCGK